MDDSIVKPAWKKFLATIQSIYPTAIIAGGALRDTIIGNSIKDVDIFISCPTLDPDEDSYVTEEMLTKLFGITESSDDYVKICHDFREDKCEGLSGTRSDNGYAGDSTGPNHNPVLESFITMIAEVKYNSIKYELIFVEDDPAEFVLRDFDIGLCKIFFDGDQLFVTDEFKYDLDNKQLTFSGRFTKGQILHTITTHIPNLKKKFVDWNVVIDDVSVKTKEDMPESYKQIFEEAKKPELDLTFNKAERDNPFVIDFNDRDRNRVFTDEMLKNMIVSSTSKKYKKLIFDDRGNITHIEDEYEDSGDDYKSYTAQVNPWISKKQIAKDAGFDQDEIIKWMDALKHS